MPALGACNSPNASVATDSGSNDFLPAAVALASDGDIVVTGADASDAWVRKFAP